MVLLVFANNKVVGYQLLGGLFGRRPGHQLGIRPRSPAFILINKDGPKSHFWLRGCSPGFAGIRGVSGYPLW
jgi:hypothetical protein